MRRWFTRRSRIGVLAICFLNLGRETREATHVSRWIISNQQNPDTISRKLVPIQAPWTCRIPKTWPCKQTSAKNPRMNKRVGSGWDFRGRKRWRESKEEGERKREVQGPPRKVKDPVREGGYWKRKDKKPLGEESMVFGKKVWEVSWEFSLGASWEKGGVLNGEFARRGNVGIQIGVKNERRVSS